MNDERARQLLDAAVEMGLVEARQGASADEQLAALVAEGRLSTDTLRDLEAELGRHATARPHCPGFELEKQLGSGGAGRVWSARDPKLGRQVALKFLHGFDPRATVRLLREARAQSRLDHPHICRVYAVGESDGQPFIVMQLVDGPTLEAAAPSLGLDDKLAILADCARALHFAHGRALVHRDLKPSNVLLERRPDGRLTAYVADFGAAQDDQHAASMSVPVAGTPAFMSPEQARGDAAVDARADVYALGATLYAVLAGKPPFTGTPLEIVHAVLESSPPSLASIPGVPRPLCELVSRCMARLPQDRYQTALAVADDLDRIRAGEPLGPLPRRFRFGRIPLAVKIGALVAVLGATGGGLLWRNRAAQAERVRLASRVGERVQRVLGDLRQAELLPRHDLRPEKARARRSLAEIEASAAVLGQAELDAIAGRLAYALGDLDEAQQRLEAAYTAGQRSPELERTLGKTLSALYQRGLDRIFSIRDPALAATRRQELQHTLRDPAIAHLRAVSPSEAGAELPYLEAELALQEGRYAFAVERAKTAAVDHPELFELHALVAEALDAEARELVAAGKISDALAVFAKSATEYRAALDIGRSATAVYTADCRRLRSELSAAGRIHLPAADLAERSRQALERCSQGLETDPDSAILHEARASVWLSNAENDISTDRDPIPSIKQLILDADKASSLAGNDGTIFTLLARAHRIEADYLSSHGGDPTAAFAAAVTASDQAIERAPRTAQTHFQRCRILNARAAFDLARMRDPTADFEAAMLSCDRAVALSPGFRDGLLECGDALTRLGAYRYEHGQPWRASYGEAQQRLEAALAQDPRDISTATALAFLHLKRGEFELYDGHSSEADERAATALLESILAKKPDEPVTTMALALARALTARRLGSTGADASREFAAAEHILDARQLFRHDPDFLYNEALIGTWWAQHLADTRRDPSAVLARYRRVTAEARRQRPEDNDLDGQETELELAALEVAPSHSATAKKLAAKIEELLQRTKRRAKETDGYYLLSSARLGRLKLQKLDPDDRAAVLAQARADVQAALALTPNRVSVLAERDRLSAR